MATEEIHCERARGRQRSAYGADVPKVTFVAAALAFFLALPGSTTAQYKSGPAALHHAIATRSTQAQSAFDRGLALVYAFNFAAAERAFSQASTLDPSAAMPYWGLALAEGPNYNAMRPGMAMEQAASAALAKGRDLAAGLAPGPETAEERAYIEALTLRFSCAPRANYPQLEAAYDKAMGELSASHPDDPDAATLFAEGLMEQRAWQFWDAAGTPGPETRKILEVLESVLKRWPDHLGANHLYIHAAEASLEPARALASARRLDQLGAGGFAGDGHLLHLPAHIFVRTGDFRAAENATVAAAGSDRAYVRAHPEDVRYRDGYAKHNLSFLVYAASMDGDYSAALRAAEELDDGAPSSDPVARLRVWLRFGRWGQILDSALPANASTGTLLYWHYARATAFASDGDAAKAMLEERAIRTVLNAPTVEIGSPAIPKQALHALTISAINGRVAAARGNMAFALQQWGQSVAAGDALGYREPPAWYPVRESLGAMLLRAGEPQKAETVFRDCLERVPGDARALFGAWQALAAHNRPVEAEAMHERFLSAWKGGDLRLTDF